MGEGRSTPEPVQTLTPSLIQKRGKQVISQGTKENLEINSAQGLLSELTQNLKADQTLRLSISWVVEESSTES